MVHGKNRLSPTLLLAALALTPLAPLAPLFGVGGSGGSGAAGATGASGAPPAGRKHGGDVPYFDDERMERRADHQAERLTRALDLTPEQQVSLGRLQETLENAVSPLGEQMRSAHRQLRTLLDDENPEAVAVGTQAIAMDRARDGMRTAWERFETDFTTILSETQRAAYRAIQETRPDRGGFGERRGHGRHDHHGERGERGERGEHRAPPPRD